MYLKSLEMQGFKSFVDRVNITFDDGITAVVGPNGSGKSNISDALRWVLGEQSAKTLRGTKMEDVIFAGTEKRKPTGFAEVTLTLDNSGHVFDVDYNEIAITRRVFRSGESEYSINKTPCRLKDIHELFMDTGLGRDGYSIIGQGKIDEVLSAKSEDRRQIFEEAAGVSKYKYRKIEAERKLAGTEENLVRIRDIISELDRQVEPLKEQSEKAKRFLALRDELKELEVNLFIIQMEKNKASLSEINTAYETALADLERARKELAENEAKTEQLYEKQREHDSASEKQREAIHELELANARIESEIAICTTNIENTEATIRRIQMGQESGKSKEAELNDAISETEERISGLRTKQNKIEETIRSLEEDAAKKKEYASELSEQIEITRQEMLDANKQASESKHRMENMGVLRENYLEQIEKMEQELSESKEHLENLEEEQKTTLKRKEKLDAARNEAKNKFLDAVAEKQRMDDITEQKKGEYNRLSAELNQKQSRKKVLSDMEQHLEGYSKSVKSLIAARDAKRIPGLRLFGVLSKLITVPNQYVTAIEVALAAAAQNLIVESESDAKEAISYLKKNDLGRATFLPISSVQSKKLDALSDIKNCTGFIGIASDLVECEPKLEGAVRHLLGRTVVVENIDAAVQMGRKFKQSFKIVTLQGEVINAGGAITGGSRMKGGGLIGREREIEELTKECKSLEKQLEKLDDQIEDSISASKEQEQVMEELRKEQMKAESESLKEEGNITLNQERMDRMVERRASLLRETEDIQRQLAAYEEEKGQFDSVIASYQEKEREAEEKLKTLQETFRTHLAVREDADEKIVAERMNLNECMKDIEVAEVRKSELKQMIEDNKQEHRSQGDLIVEAEEAIQSIKKEIEQKKEQFTQNERLRLELNASMLDLVAAKSASDDEIKQLREASRSMTETVFALQNECGRMENKKSKAEMEQDTIVNRMWDDYELTLSDALTLKSDSFELQGAQKRAQTIRKEIKGMGNINVDSIEEYRSVKERFEFLSGQRDDLEAAKANLNQIIQDLTHSMKEQFAEKFVVIREEFNRVFNQLFGGGRADLVFTDQEDVLNSGIEIEVQPPGKKLQNLSLLSGGERAFTAIALLFAILKVRPTPFCILDEIEAALDDVNVYRFADYLKHYSDATQFIIITHRRGTMEAAKILYGITMQEKGVSKLLAMNLEDVEN